MCYGSCSLCPYCGTKYCENPRETFKYWIYARNDVEAVMDPVFYTNKKADLVDRLQKIANGTWKRWLKKNFAHQIGDKNVILLSVTNEEASWNNAEVLAFDLETRKLMRYDKKKSNIYGLDGPELSIIYKREWEGKLYFRY